jgi:hypothetical protein
MIRGALSAPHQQSSASNQTGPGLAALPTQHAFEALADANQPPQRVSSGHTTAVHLGWELRPSLEMGRLMTTPSTGASKRAEAPTKAWYLGQDRCYEARLPAALAGPVHEASWSGCCVVTSNCI